jgi:hypothetical protein
VKEEAIFMRMPVERNKDKTACEKKAKGENVPLREQIPCKAIQREPPPPGQVSEQPSNGNITIILSE